MIGFCRTAWGIVFHIQNSTETIIYIELIIIQPKELSKTINFDYVFTITDNPVS